MNKNILITGAAGFIGSFLCEELVANGYSIIGIDNFFRGNIKNIGHLSNNKNFLLEKLDLSLSENINRVKELITDNNIHTVFHLAAINGTQYFYDRPLFVLDQNVKITQNLLAAIENTPVNYIIYTSSSEIYSDANVIPTNEQQPILLNAAADRDSYAASKALGDFYVRLFSQQHHLSCLILRVFNLYGERMVGTRYGQVIPEFIHRLLFEDTFTIIGDGTNTRSFCYIDDAVGAMKELMERKTKGIVNIGNNHETTILDLAKLIHQISNRSFNPTFLPKRTDDHQRRCPDITYLKSLLPEFKLTSLKTGLEKIMAYYSKSTD